VLGENRRTARRQKDAGDQVEHVVRAVTEDDLVLAKAGRPVRSATPGDQVELVRVTRSMPPIAA
jgi:hypothetical protein